MAGIDAISVPQFQLSTNLEDYGALLERLWNYLVGQLFNEGSLERSVLLLF